jgi:hypothetical protein
VIVTPRQLADPDAVAIANPHVYICEPIEILVLAQDAIDAWREIRSTAMNLDGAAARLTIGRRLSDRRVLPSSIRERLVSRSIAE